MFIDSAHEVMVKQRREAIELLGLETRNKYVVTDPQGRQLGYAAEQGKGFGATMGRMFMGHWRAFDIFVFDGAGQRLLCAHHPFRWMFRRLEISDAAGVPQGAVQQRFALFRRVFDVLDAQGQLVLQMRGGFFSVWTFPFFRGEREMARIEKKFSGLLKEAFTDADTFRVAFGDGLGAVERRLVLCAALLVDLAYFEHKAGQ